MTAKTYYIQNQFYFLTDPDVFVCTHLPDDPAWQLLPQPLSAQQFESYVYIREQYFRLGMYMVDSSHQEGTLHSKDGEVTVTFGLPQERIRHTQFSYLLFCGSQSGVKSNKLLERTVIFSKYSDTVSYTVWFSSHWYIQTGYIRQG